MKISPRFTSADLELLPKVEGWRYEIVDGELHVSTAPSFQHQYASTRTASELDVWSRQTGLGLATAAPGLVLASDDDVIPDVIWVSHERLATALDQAGHFRVAPELVVEVLSPGSTNEHRDREVKLRLYSRQGVDEYWIVDWRRRLVQVYRREDAALALVTTLRDGDVLTSPLLPGFACPVASLWAPV